MNVPKNEQSPYLLRLITPYFSGSRDRLSLADNNVFVVSSGRTGTKFIADYFSQYDDVSAVHEPKGSRLLRMWSTAKLEGKAKDDDLANVLYKKRCKQSEKSGIYIESNPYLSGFAGVLDEVFENAVIIHVVRDPRTYVKSALDHGNAGGLKNIFNKYVPFWYPDVTDIFEVKKNVSPKLRVALYWKLVNEFLSEQGKNNNNYHLLKFEDIFDKSGTGLKKLGDAIGIDVDTDKKSLPAAVNKSRSNSAKAWSQWTDEECRELDKIWRPLSKKYGYCQDKEWINKISG